MDKIKFYDAIVKNGIGVNLESFDRRQIKKDICLAFNESGFSCKIKSGSLSLSKDKVKITDIVLDKYGVYFSSGIVSEMIEPINILTYFLAETTFN